MKFTTCISRGGYDGLTGRSHPPQCTNSREDRPIVRMTVTDRTVTSRTTAQHIVSVTHLSASAHTIRRRLQQSGLSARRPFLDLPLTQHYRPKLGSCAKTINNQSTNGAMKKGCEWQNVMKLSLLTSYSSVCNTTMVGFESGDTVERGRWTAALCTATLVLHRVLWYGQYWISLSHFSSTHCRYFKQIALHFGGFWSQLSFLTFRAWSQPYFNRITNDYTWHALSKGSSSITRFNCFPNRLTLRIFCR
ncbi:HTH_38 domain-containing protein [Trichonephila clavipes]|nr:HTH_38 domain-containing protein [Trichonephila clavipes]